MKKKLFFLEYNSLECGLCKQDATQFSNLVGYCITKNDVRFKFRCLCLKSYIYRHIPAKPKHLMSRIKLDVL